MCVTSCSSSYLTRTDFVVVVGNPSSKDVMAAAGARVFNSNLWSRSNIEVPSWFPKVHKLFLLTERNAGLSFLAASEKATFSWIPSYTILLHGDEKTLAQR